MGEEGFEKVAQTEGEKVLRQGRLGPGVGSPTRHIQVATCARLAQATDEGESARRSRAV